MTKQKQVHSDYSLESSWAWHYKIGTPVFGEFLPFFSADHLNLCQVGWGALLHSYFQVSPEIDWVQVRALAGPLKDIQSLFPKPLLRCLGCVFRVVVLNLCSQSVVLSALEQVFIKDLSVLCSVNLSLNPDSSPSPCHSVSALGTSLTIPLTSWLGFCSDMHCQLRDLIKTGVCLSK